MSEADHFEPGIATDQEAEGTAERLLTARRVAALLGRTCRTLRNWERRGWLRPVRIGRGIFYRPHDIEALAERGAPQDPPPRLQASYRYKLGQINAFQPRRENGHDRTSSVCPHPFSQLSAIFRKFPWRLKWIN